MVRVSSFGQQALLINGLMQNQNRVFEGQRQITSGKKSDDYAGLAGNTGTVLGAKSFKSRVETYERTIDTISGKLDANDVQISGMISAVEALQENMQTAIANNQAEGLPEMMEQTFKFIANSLNTNFDGTFLFSGAKTGTQPITVNSLADLAALPTVADAFDNGNIAFEARIADGVDLEFGLLADDIAADVFQLLSDLYNFHTGGSGPLADNLDPTQFSYIQGELSTITNVLDGMRQEQVQNGLAFERLEVVDDQHKDTKVFLETFISDMEDVDIAEAVTRLNNDQVALEASYQAIGALSRLSLLQFL